MEADKGSGEIQGTLYFGYRVHALSDRGESGGAKVLSTMTGVVEKGLENTSFSIITKLTLILLGLYLLRIAFRFLSNYLAHKAAWYLVGDLRSRMYDKLQHLDLGFFHDKRPEI